MRRGAVPGLVVLAAVGGSVGAAAWNLLHSEAPAVPITGDGTPGASADPTLAQLSARLDGLELLVNRLAADQRLPLKTTPEQIRPPAIGSTSPSATAEDRLRELEDVIALLRERLAALEQRPGNEGPSSGVGFRLTLGQIEARLNALDVGAIELSEKNWAWLIAAGGTQGAGDDRRIELLATWLDRSAGTKDGAGYLVRLLGLLGARQDHEEALAALLRYGPRVPMRAWMRSVLEYRVNRTLDRWGESERALTAALSAPDIWPRLREYGELQRGALLEAQDRFEAARQTWVRVKDDESVSQPIRHQARWMLANSLQREGRLDEARKLLRELIDLDERERLAVWLRTNVQRALEQLDEAESKK